MVNERRFIWNNLKELKLKKKCKIKRSLYGLKQSLKCWKEALDIQLKGMHFRQLENDPCIYTLFPRGEISIAAVYVDVIILAYSILDTNSRVYQKISTSRTWGNYIISWVLKLLIRSQGKYRSDNQHTPQKFWKNFKRKIYCSSYRLIGLVGRVFANGPGDLGSIPGRVIPKT